MAGGALKRVPWRASPQDRRRALKLRGELHRKLVVAASQVQGELCRRRAASL